MLQTDAYFSYMQVSMSAIPVFTHSSISLAIDLSTEDHPEERKIPACMTSAPIIKAEKSSVPVVAWAGHATYGSYLGSVSVCYGTV